MRGCENVSSELERFISAGFGCGREMLRPDRALVHRLWVVDSGELWNFDDGSGVRDDGHLVSCRWICHIVHCRLNTKERVFTEEGHSNWRPLLLHA